MRRAIGTLLLILATTHCVMSIFYVNTSWLNLHKYAYGLERLPYQGRLLMIPVVRWSEGLPVLQSLAARYGKSVPQLEPMTVEKLICLIVAIVSANALGLALCFYSARLKIQTWWLSWAILVAILYASFAARYEQTLWYPYDIPHVLMFGLATIAIFAGEPMLFFGAFIFDVAIRETACFLLPVAAVFHHRSVLWRSLTAGGVILWIGSRILVHVLFPHSFVETTKLLWRLNFLAPQHLPQLFSIVGFLWIPVLLGRGHLAVPYKRALMVISCTMLITFYFAVWDETRVWCEWATAFAIMAGVELEAVLGRQPLIDPSDQLSPELQLSSRV